MKLITPIRDSNFTRGYLNGHEDGAMEAMDRLNIQPECHVCFRFIDGTLHLCDQHRYDLWRISKR